MKELNNIIAGNISALRTKFGMTQLELAEKMNYSDKLISKWERGDAIPVPQALKQLSEIFEVSIDYLFVSHDEDEPQPETLPEKESKIRKEIVMAISIGGIWILAFLLFVILWLAGHFIWMIFVYAIPISLVTFLVLNSVWKNGKHNCLIVGALIASILLTIYLALYKYNFWQIFLMLIPTELVVFLCGKLKKPVADE